MRFLSVAEVLEIHAAQLARFGGGSGVRSQALLESAVAQAEATFAGEKLHVDLFEMAAAYLFHIVQNHPASARYRSSSCTDWDSWRASRAIGMGAALGRLRPSVKGHQGCAPGIITTVQ